MFAFQRDDIVPDILALSKTLGCGLPVASVSTTVEIEKLALKGGYLWITTHYNDPLAAALASKVIEIVVRDNCCKLAKERGKQLREGLLRLQDKYWCIRDIRGRGLLHGVEVISDPVTQAPGVELVIAVSEKAIDLGLSCQAVAVPGACAAPPVTVSAEEIEAALLILDQAFAAVSSADAYQSVAMEPHL
jgi:4-aminobutyrate aminotransferase-like enzyme